ncbi:MAG: helix-turn-helix domain-containing protein [Acidimicrobiales bacterium]
MPERDVVRLHRADGVVSVTWGPRVLFRFDEADTGMRNLAMVAIGEAGVAGTEVAAAFGLSADHFSKLRVRVRRLGSAELVRPMGRPPKLTGADMTKARRWAGEGVTGTEIARRLGVSDATVSRALAGAGVALALVVDPVNDNDDNENDNENENTGDDNTADGDDSDSNDDDDASDDASDDDDDVIADATEIGVEVAGSKVVTVTRLGQAETRCRYTGAMLLLPFLDLVGAGDLLGLLGSGPARRYDSTTVALCAMFGLALGTGSVEATKHLGRADLGALAGIGAAPELATLRTRLSALADGCDPLGLQVALTRALIASAAPPEQVFFIDDHFVPYYGAAPVAKGWNTKRRHAQPGRDDTYICDLAGRALCFTSSEPSGLSVTMRAAVAELRKACGDRPITLGFDRGGSYPVAFSWLRDQGVTWLTWRRGELAPPGATPRWSWFVLDGRRHTYKVADATIDLPGYGPARQITLFEGGEAVAQILTCDTISTPARMVHLLRCRWRIENAFKYLAAHNGIDALCDYGMEMVVDRRSVTNPARTSARATLRSLQADFATTEAAIGAAFASRGHSQEKLAELARLNERRAMIIDEIEEAEAELGCHRAKLAANELDPDATRALPRLRRRSLQMVLRLLAYNAELWLSERLDAYLADPDEVRAITRHLLRQPGTIAYGASGVTVTIDRPDQPRIARALRLLADELNATPAHIPGDNRPIAYRISA